MTQYVVLKPKITFYAFGGCYEVLRITNEFIFYLMTRGEAENRDAWEEKVSKKNVLFIIEEDISNEISQWNTVCWKEYKALQNKMKVLQLNIKQKYSSK